MASTPKATRNLKKAGAVMERTLYGKNTSNKVTKGIAKKASKVIRTVHPDVKGAMNAMTVAYGGKAQANKTEKKAASGPAKSKQTPLKPVPKKK